MGCWLWAGATDLGYGNVTYNIADRTRKKRSSLRTGELHPLAKITDEIAIGIFEYRKKQGNSRLQTSIHFNVQIGDR